MKPIRRTLVTAVVTLMKPLGANKVVEFDFAWRDDLERSTEEATFEGTLKVISGPGGDVWKLAHEGPWITAEALAGGLRRNPAVRNVRVRP